MNSANTLKRGAKTGVATPFLVALGFLLMIHRPAAAQFDVAFTVKTSEVQGTCSLNGGAQQTINPVDSASANTNGVSMDTMSTASVTACGVNFFTSGATATEALAGDTTTTDDGEAKDRTTTLNILGGLVTSDSEQTDHQCVATSSTSGTCNEQATFGNLALAGSPLPLGTFTGPQSFNIIGLQLAGGGCNLLATYDGTLTVGELDPPAGQSTNQTEFYALRLQATETCLLPLFTVKWDIQSNGGFVASPSFPPFSFGPAQPTVVFE